MPKDEALTEDAILENPDLLDRKVHSWWWLQNRARTFVLGTSQGGVIIYCPSLRWLEGKNIYAIEAELSAMRPHELQLSWLATIPPNGGPVVV